MKKSLLLVTSVCVLIPIILGCDIAHEIGHLLLGSESHSASGIMQGHWERGQIRQAVTQKRMRLQSSAPRGRSEASAELTTGAVVDAEPQNVSSINATPLLSVHQNARDRHPRMIVRFHNSALPSQTQTTSEPQRSAPARHFVCNTGYTREQCDEEMVVLRTALAKYPAPGQAQRQQEISSGFCHLQ
jgi:hypothetical protein